MQLLKKERESERLSLDFGVCIYVCVRDTKPDQCQHVELIRLVISAWKRDGEKDGKVRERKQAEEDEIEDEKGGRRIWTKRKSDQGQM